MAETDPKVYFKGECFGTYGAGAVVVAIRDAPPCVVQGSYYTIAEVVEQELACDRNVEVILKEVEGTYVRNAFRVDQECLRRTGVLKG